MVKSTTVRLQSGSTLRVQLFVLIAVIVLIAIALAFIFLPPSSVSDIQLSRSDTSKSSSSIDIRHSPSKSSTSDNRYICLPSNNLPTLYTLRLQLFLPYRMVLDYGTKNYTTEGDLRIDFNCVQSNDRVVLNAKHINIDSSTILLLDSSNRSISIVDINTYRYEPDDIHVVEFLLDSFLLQGSCYSMYLRYHGRIGDVWAGGLYKADYDIDGEIRSFIKFAFYFLASVENFLNIDIII